MLFLTDFFVSLSLSLSLSLHPPVLNFMNIFKKEKCIEMTKNYHPEKSIMFKLTDKIFVINFLCFCSHFHNDANVLDEDIIQYNA